LLVVLTIYKVLYIPDGAGFLPSNSIIDSPLEISEAKSLARRADGVDAGYQFSAPPE